VRIGLPGCGHEEFKRPPETSAGTARDYSTTFRLAGKDCRHRLLAILLSQGSGKREEEKKRREDESGFRSFGAYREACTIRIMPGRRMATLRLSRLRAATVVR